MRKTCSALQAVRNDFSLASCLSNITRCSERLSAWLPAEAVPATLHTALPPEWDVKNLPGRRHVRYAWGRHEQETRA